MTTIGLMAGDIAHEVKRPLSVLALSADQLKACCDRGELTPGQVNPILEIILRNVSLMEEIVRSLASFLREGAEDPFETVLVKRILDDTITLCQHGFQRDKIELRLPEIPHITVECRSCQLTQVLANLLNNARDASLVFAVTDSGAIPVPEIRQKLFQSLFTTKAPGAGMGLGLSISKRLVENHKGRCYLDENHPNTRFVVEVPLRQAGR